MRRGAVVLGAVAVVLASCASAGDHSGSPAGSAPVAGPVVVTFEVEGGERFRALLTHDDDIAIARRLLADDDAAPGIPNGRIVHRTGVNTGWSWSLDPDDIEFADTTVEACDGRPSDVEAGLVTGDRYCPWSAQVVAVDPAP